MRALHFGHLDAMKKLNQRQTGRHMARVKGGSKKLVEISKTALIEIPAEENAPCFPIVGIGASAGGLAAFEAFFSTMPADTFPGMAFVLVQHLARDHKSILSELIRRYTCIRV